MKIGIIGGGGIGKLYARLWQAAGHEIKISSRNPDKLAGFAAKFEGRVTVGTPAEAADFGDVVLLSVNYQSLGEAVQAIRSSVEGKLVVDATNPLKFAEGGGLERMIPDGAVAGTVMAKKLPRARVAKAFTSLWPGHVEREVDRLSPRVAMPFAADAEVDRAVVADLIRDAGLAPVSLGTLAQSRPLDPGSPIWNVVLGPEELRERVENYRASLPDTA